MKITVYILLLISAVYAQEKSSQRPPPSLAAGIGYMEKTALFKYPENDTFPLPFISWTTENFYFRGLSFGYYVYKKFPQIAVTLHPVTLEIDNDEGTFNEAIGKRHRSLNAGLDASFPTRWVMINLQFQHDILAVYQGWITSLDIRKRFAISGKLSMTPGVQLQYYSKNYMDYYFGIDSDEARTNREVYEPTGDFSWGPTVVTMYQLENDWTLMLMTRYTKFGSEVANSPLIARDDQFSFLFSATTNF